MNEKYVKALLVDLEEDLTDAKFERAKIDVLRSMDIEANSSIEADLLFVPFR